MIIDGNGDGFLHIVLPNDIFVEMLFNLFGFEKFYLLGRGFFLDDIDTESDAFIADIGARSSEELVNGVFSSPAKRTAIGGVGFLAHFVSVLSSGVFFSTAAAVAGFAI